MNEPKGGNRKEIGGGLEMSKMGAKHILQNIYVSRLNPAINREKICLGIRDRQEE